MAKLGLMIVIAAAVALASCSTQPASLFADVSAPSVQQQQGEGS